MVRRILLVEAPLFRDLCVDLRDSLCGVAPSPYPSPSGGGDTVYPLPAGEGGQRPGEGPPRHPLIALTSRKIDASETFKIQNDINERGKWGCLNLMKALIRVRRSR